MITVRNIGSNKLASWTVFFYVLLSVPALLCLWRYDLISVAFLLGISSPEFFETVDWAVAPRNYNGALTQYKTVLILYAKT